MTQLLQSLLFPLFVLARLELSRQFAQRPQNIVQIAVELDCLLRPHAPMRDDKATPGQADVDNLLALVFEGECETIPASTAGLRYRSSNRPTRITSTARPRPDREAAGSGGGAVSTGR